MHIGAIMQEKGGVIFSTRPDSTLGDVVDQLLDRHISSLVVISTAGELVGIVTERDIVRTLKTRANDWKQVLVSEVMTRDLYVADLDATLDTVIGEMRERHIRHLPVVVDGDLQGGIVDSRPDRRLDGRAGASQPDAQALYQRLAGETRAGRLNARGGLSAR